MSSIHIRGDSASVLIEINRYENENPIHPSDANWLAAEIEINAGPFRGRYAASLTTHEVACWHDELDALLEGKKLDIALFTYEGWLQVELKMNLPGNITARCVASANDPSRSALSFSLELDPAALTKVRDEFKDVVKNFPIKA